MEEDCGQKLPIVSANQAEISGINGGEPLGYGLEDHLGVQTTWTWHFVDQYNPPR